VLQLLLSRLSMHLHLLLLLLLLFMGIIIAINGSCAPRPRTPSSSLLLPGAVCP
jgi:hypothetical protein